MRARLARLRGCARDRPVVCPRRPFDPPSAAPCRRAERLVVGVPRGSWRMPLGRTPWRRWSGCAATRYRPAHVQRRRRRAPRAPPTTCAPTPPRPSTQEARRCAPWGAKPARIDRSVSGGAPKRRRRGETGDTVPEPESPALLRWATVAGHDAHVLRLREGLALLTATPRGGLGRTVVPKSRGLPQKEGRNGRHSRSRDTRYGTRGPGSRADRNAKTSIRGLLAGDDGASHRRRPSSKKGRKPSP